MGQTKEKKKAARQVIDFTDAEVPKFKTGTERVMTKKQIRARARRAGKIYEAELEKLYKPLEEWDEEELARGRPRAADGTFRGSTPKWITREMHESAMNRFKGIIEGRMRQETVTAMSVVHAILSNEEEDEKGRPVVPAGTKLDAAKFLIEHAVGKPTQRMETDISVKLQGLLAMATVGPANGGVELFELGAGDGVMDLEDDDIIEDTDA